MHKNKKCNWIRNVDFCMLCNAQKQQTTPYVSGIKTHMWILTELRLLVVPIAALAPHYVVHCPYPQPEGY